MAVLHVKTPNGTTKSINLETMNIDYGVEPTSSWFKLPNGIIIQWGHGVQTETDIIHPITFTTIKSCAMAIHIGTNPIPNIILYSTHESSTDSSYFLTDYPSSSQITIYWITIGY